MQFTRVVSPVEDMEIWNASSDGFSLFHSSTVIASVITNITQALDFCKTDGFKREFYCWYVPQRSTLYVPLQHFPSLSLPVAVVTLFCYGVLAYLAAPLVMSVIRAVLPRRAWTVSWHV